MIMIEANGILTTLFVEIDFCSRKDYVLEPDSHQRVTVRQRIDLGEMESMTLLQSD